ncbi:hypothetical protein FACS1894217_12820 [Clostridia bacterium]|nr:hypothetical protein FACS1894217_12820 [Clostridia bacterium]
MISPVLKTTKTEFVKWITNPRMIVFFVMIIFIKTVAIEPLMARADKMGLPLNILEPFIAVGNSELLAMLIPAVFLVLMSDFPIIGGNTLFFISRTGRTRWFLGQMLFSLTAISVYVFSVMLFSALFSIGNSEFGDWWSDSTRFYAFRFPEDQDLFVAALLPANLYNQIGLFTATLHTFAFTVLYLFLLCEIIFLFKILGLRMAGLISAVVVIAIGVATTSLRETAMWFSPMGNTIIWLHYTEILREPIKPVPYSYIYFAILILAVFALAFVAVKKANFNTLEDN